jgi:hypothetical protein
MKKKGGDSPGVFGGGGVIGGQTVGWGWSDRDPALIEAAFGSVDAWLVIVHKKKGGTHLEGLGGRHHWRPNGCVGVEQQSSCSHQGGVRFCGRMVTHSI